VLLRGTALEERHRYLTLFLNGLVAPGGNAERGKVHECRSPLSGLRDLLRQPTEAAQGVLGGILALWRWPGRKQSWHCFTSRWLHTASGLVAEACVVSKVVHTVLTASSNKLRSADRRRTGRYSSRPHKDVWLGRTSGRDRLASGFPGHSRATGESRLTASLFAGRSRHRRKG